MKVSQQNKVKSEKGVKPLEIGSYVRIANHARYGGTTLARGALVPQYLKNREYLVTDLVEIKGVQEA